MRGRVAAAAALAALGWAPVARGEAVQKPVLGVFVEERYDSAAFAPGDSELMTKVSPELGYSLTDHGLKLEAGYALDLIQHLRAGNLTTDHRAKLDYKHKLTEKLSLKASGAFYRVEDMTSLPRFGVARVRAPALWSWGEAEVDDRLTHTETLAAGYRAEFSRIFLAGFPLGSSHSAFLQLRSQRTRRLELGARLRGQIYLLRTSRYADAATATVSGRYLLSRHTFVSLEGGPTLFRSVGGSQAFMPRLAAEVGYDARGLALGLAAGRDVVGSLGYAEAVWADYASAVATWRATPVVSLTLAGGYYRNGRAPDGPLTSDGLAGTAVVEWKLARGLSAAATYDHLHQFGAAGTALGLARDIVSLKLGYRTP